MHVKRFKFTEQDVLAQVIRSATNTFDFVNHTGFIIDRIRLQHGYSVGPKQDAAKVKRMLDKLADAGHIERSKYFLASYGYCWKLK